MSMKVYTAKNGARYTKDRKGQVRFIGSQGRRRKKKRSR